MTITESKQIVGNWKAETTAETSMLMPPAVSCVWWTHSKKADLSCNGPYRSSSFTADELEQVAEMIYNMAKRMRE